MNLSTNFQALAAAFPERECVVTPNRRITYGQIAERARRLASLLHVHGLGCHQERSALANHHSGQDHLGIYLLNCPEYVEAMLGSYAARVAPFNVNYRYVDDELVYLLEDSDAVALVYHARYAPTLARIRSRLPKLRLLLQVDDGFGETLLPGALDYEDALASASPEGPAVTPSSDDLYIIYTGGTTGAPKGVLWRQDDIYQGAMTGGVPGLAGPTVVEDLVAEAMPGSYLHAMITPPFMHGAAQWVGFGTLHKGGTLVLQGKPDRFDADEVWSLVEREHANTMAIVGDAFARPLIEQLDRKKYDLSGLYVLGSGGAILSPHNKQAFLERIPHVTVVDGFGASETGAHGSRASRAGEEASTGSFSMQQTVVMKQDMSGLLAPGSDEIGWAGRTGHVPLGYYKDAAKTARTFPVVGGVRYAVPGDHGRIAPDGAIVVLGRGSVSINTGGEKVYAEEVEESLKRHGGVDDCLVLGVPDERFGQRVVAVASRVAGTQAAADDVLASVRAELADYKVPRDLVWLAEVPRAPNGKADYKRARTAYEDAALAR